MAATVKIFSIHDDDSTTSISDAGMRFKLADDDTENLVNPCRIPTSDQVAIEIPFTYSFRKHIHLFICTEPVNTITNLRFFTDGDENGELGTGIVLLGDSTETSAAYNDSDISADSTGDTTCTWLIVSTGGSAHFWTKAAPQVVNAGTVYTNGDETLGDALQVAGSQNFITLQIRIANSASPGTFPSSGTRTLSYRYDEN